jgi:hypothetical protein
MSVCKEVDVSLSVLCRVTFFHNAIWLKLCVFCVGGSGMPEYSIETSELTMRFGSLVAVDHAPSEF